MRLLFLTGIRRISLKMVWISVVGLAVFNAAADSAFIVAPLQRTGVDGNASGLVTITLGPTNSSLVLLATNLTPGSSYAVMSGGIRRGTFVAERNGRAQVSFSQPGTPGTQQFNFDPRGRQFEVVQGGRAVLRARISGANEPRHSIVREEVTLPRAPGATGGAANASYELLADGTRRFSVTLTNVRDGTWRLHVDGIRRGNIVVSGGTGRIAFDNRSGTPEPALRFDPRGLVIDITRTNSLRFSGRFQARARGINLATPSVQDFVIPPVVELPSGFARARRMIDRDARRESDIELVNVPVGDYELFINDVFQGLIPVVEVPTGTEGQIEFASEPDDEDERLLDFNIVTNSFAISVGGVVLFQGQPLAVSADTTVLAPVRLVLPLFNLGRDADGIARVRFKRDERGSRHFQVVLRNVPAGVYLLTVEENPFATIFVGTAPGGTIGVIELEDEPELGEFPMNLDPLGKTLGIERDGARFFERTFPANP